MTSKKYTSQEIASIISSRFENKEEIASIISSQFENQGALFNLKDKNAFFPISPEDEATKEKLKPLFEGKSEKEIDAAVLSLKQILDQAAEEVKGEIDIEEVERVKEKDCPIIVHPLKEGEIPETRQEMIAKLIQKNPIKNTPNVTSTPLKELQQSEKKNTYPFEDLELECYDTTYEIDCVRKGIGDPISKFEEALWSKRAGPIEEKVYDQYKVSKNISKIKRKKKWNLFVSKCHLKKLQFDTYKEERILNEAMQAMFMHLNYMDNDSIEKMNAIISNARARSRSYNDRMEVPILYANPL